MVLITTDIKIDVAHNKAELKLRNGNCMEIVQHYAIARHTGKTLSHRVRLNSYTTWI